MNKIILFLCLCCLHISAAGSTIDEIIANISCNNADIKAAISQLASDSIDISSTNYLEDPSVDFEYLFGDKSVGDKWAIGISQGFEWPGIYHSRKQANKSKLSALSYSASIKRLEILYQAKLLCLDVINTNKQIALWQQLYDSYAEIYDRYSSALEKREISILDMNKLKIELVNVSQNIAQMKIRLDETVKSLNAMNGNGDIPDSLIKGLNFYPNDDLLPLEDYIMQYGRFDPESKYYAEMSNAYTAEQSVARMGWLPKFSVGYKYSNEIGDGFNGFTIGVSIPLFANKKKTKAAKAQKLSNEYTAQNLENIKYARIRTAFAKAASLQGQLAAYNSAVDFNANQELLLQALDGRQISLLDYIREVTYFVEAQQETLNIEYDLHCAIAELNKYTFIQ